MNDGPEIIGTGSYFWELHYLYSGGKPGFQRGDQPMGSVREGNYLRTVLPLLWPVLVIPYLLVKYFYKGLFEWWLDPLLQRKKDSSLAEDVEDSMPFVSSHGRRLDIKLPSQPFDYASVKVEIGTVLLDITRGRNEHCASLGRTDNPTECFELSMILETLGAEDYHRLRGSVDLTLLDEFLRVHWEDLNKALSGNDYHDMRREFVRTVKRHKTRVRVMN